MQFYNYVERLFEYLQTMRMSAMRVDVSQENVSFLTLEKNETGTDILSVQNILFCVWKQNVL
jgi:hypothetical protein